MYKEKYLKYKEKYNNIKQNERPVAPFTKTMTDMTTDNVCYTYVSDDGVMHCNCDKL